jgi:hypothetical protein
MWLWVCHRPGRDVADSRHKRQLPKAWNISATESERCCRVCLTLADPPATASPSHAWPIVCPRCHQAVCDCPPQAERVPPGYCALCRHNPCRCPIRADQNERNPEEANDA